MRLKLLVGNWKMNKLPSEAISFAKEVQEAIEYAKEHDIELGVAPTYLCLSALKENVSPYMKVFAQNVHFEDHGAYTGEVSCAMLKDLHVDGSIIGHSERRTYDNETSLKCSKKIHALLEHDMIPLYCVGETEEEFMENKTKDVICKQLEEGLKDLTVDMMKKIIIAYEPVWSIGTGKNASEEIAENICCYIRNKIEELYPTSSEYVRILYGGSVKPNNIGGYLKQDNVDGALVGGASLNVASFEEMIYALSK